MRSLCWPSVVAILFASLLSSIVAEEFVINGDFETDFEEFIVWPGYTGKANEAGDVNPDEVPEWIGNGGRGINFGGVSNANPESITDWSGNGGINPIADGRAPFRDNGDNESQVAFLQGVNFLTQTVTGLSVGSDYTLSFEYNSRNTASPVGELLLNGDSISLPDFNDEIFPVGDIEPWYSEVYAFTAASADLEIRFGSEPFIDGGDATLLLDNVSLIEGAGNNLISNGDFETDEFEVWPGYAGGTEVVDGPGAPFRDNGDNMTAVAFMQGASSLSQIVEGLTPGEQYVLSIDFNARACCGGEIPTAELEMDGVLIDDFPGDELFEGIAPVGANNPWYQFSMPFVAENDNVELIVRTGPAGVGGGDSTLIIDNVSIATAGIPGDFNNDGALTAIDIDLLTEEVSAGTNLAEFDLDGNNVVDHDDRTMWVEVLKNTFFGDSNLDGEFNSSDFVKVFSSGEYEDAEPLNSTWEDGDWNGDSEFNSSDFVTAFSAGGYEKGPRQQANAVPEPSSGAFLILAAMVQLTLLRRRPR